MTVKTFLLAAAQIAACTAQETAKGGYPFPAMFHALSAQGLPSQSLISEKQLVPLPLPRSAAVTDTSSHKYESPLRAFRSYRCALCSRPICIICVAVYAEWLLFTVLPTEGNNKLCLRVNSTFE